MTRFHLLLALLLTLLTSAVRAADPPASQPAIHPNSILAAKADTSTPLGAIKLHFLIFSHLANTDMRDVVLADTPGQQKFLDALAEEALATVAMNQASLKAFGPDKDSPANNPEAFLIRSASPTLAQPATVTINGDTATVTSPLNPEPMKLRRVGGKWKLTGQIPEPEVSKVKAFEGLELQGMAINTKVARAITEQIKAGKFKTREEAKAVFESLREAQLAPMMGDAYERARKEVEGPQRRE